MGVSENFAELDEGCNSHSTLIHVWCDGRVGYRRDTDMRNTG